MTPCGGYRRMHSFALVCLVYHATTTFCRCFIDWKNDPLGKTVGQMIGAARSARQNIVEGSSRGGTSRAQERLQYDVAKASLDELAGDFEAFLIESNEAPWSIDDARAIQVADLKVDEFTATKDIPHQYGSYILEMRQRFAPWLQHKQATISAQAILITIRRAAAMLVAQIRGLESATSGTPHCPECGSDMRQVVARKGPGAGKTFWSCARYPECRGSRPVVTG